MKKKKQKNRYRRKTTVSIKRKTVLYKKLMSTKRGGKEENENGHYSAADSRAISRLICWLKLPLFYGEIEREGKSRVQLLSFHFELSPKRQWNALCRGEGKGKRQENKEQQFPLDSDDNYDNVFPPPSPHTSPPRLLHCEVNCLVVFPFSLSLSKLTCLHSHTTLH